MASVLRRRWRPFLAGLLVVAMVTSVAVRGQDGDSDGLIVGLSSMTAEQDIAPLLTRSGAFVSGRLEQIDALAVQTRSGARNQLMAALERHPAVRYVEQDQRRWSIAYNPNDPLYTSGGQWSIGKIHAPEAWDLLPPGGNTVVAVLDTGVDLGHPDLVGRISSQGCDAFRRTCSRILPDFNGHGTHVAGIIGANTNNGIGISSVSGGRATILPIQVLSTGGGAIYDSTIALGIVWAVDRGAKVINMSLGGGCESDYSRALNEAITYAERNDVLIVMAAGNDLGFDLGCYQGLYPQSDERVLSVAATNKADEGTDWTYRGTWVGVAAPGDDILSTHTYLTGGYARLRGTSMAAPHVAGAAALLYQIPGATKAKVVEWLMATCDPANVSARCGGRINVHRAVSLAMTGVDPGKPQPALMPAPAATPPADPQSPTGEMPAQP
jgi:subtilisin family serine protease